MRLSTRLSGSNALSYALGIAMDAIGQHQASTSAPDVIHLAAHFLLPSIAGKPVRITIRSVRAGKRFTNLAVTMEQESKTTLTLAVLCGTLPDIPEAQSYTPYQNTLAPPSVFARRCPLSAPPKALDVTSFGRAYTFAKRSRWREDPALLKRLDDLAQQRDDENEGQRLEWGASLLA